MTSDFAPDALNTPPDAPGGASDARARHELRTPLNQIIGYTELLLEEVQEDPSAGRFAPDLERVLAASRRLLELVGGEVVGGVGADSSPQPLTTSPPTNPDAAHVLVVDDNAANRDVLRRRLEHDGHRISEAEGGEVALQRMREEAFDLVLLDVLMPGLDGVGVLEQLRQEPQLSRVPVIVLSALDELDRAVRCIELGADDYLSKPFNPVLLRARMNASLEKKRLRDAEARSFEQLREAFERVKALERWREEWTQMLVHDLRTPLTAIQGGLQTLELIDEMGDIGRELVMLSTRSSQTMMRLINDLLDVARLESGTLKLDVAGCAPRDLLQEAMAQVETLAQEKEIALSLDLAPVAPVRADFDKIVRVLVNLLGNAIKFTGSRGQVTLGARPLDADEVQFFVRDTGEGIPESALRVIFERFGQVEKRQRGRKGTGLGLTFCKLVVEAHGGTIGVQSQEGVGSEFHFSLPTS